MSDSPQVVPNDSQENLRVAAGESLRQARQAAGLHIAALAVMLKVPVKKLEALESSRFDLLPDAVFVRALAASVCRTLKIDAAPILAQLPAGTSPKLTYRGARLNEAFRAAGDAPGPSVWSQLSRPAVLAGLAFLIGALVLFFLPAIKQGVAEMTTRLAESRLASQGDTETSKLPDTAAVDKSAAPNVLTESGVAPPMGAASKGFLKADDAIRAQTTISVTASSPEPISDSTAVKPGAASGTASPTFVVNPNASLNTTSPSDVVLFTAKGESWVEATDAKGKVVLRRTLAVGDVVGAAGALPLKVIVGKANVTQVQIRGAAFDLAPVSRDNVARFEVR